MPALRQLFSCISLAVAISVCSSLPGFALTYDSLSYQAKEAAQLLGLEKDVARLLDLKNQGDFETYNAEAVKLQLSLSRKLMSTGLELRKVSAHFDREITFEQQALDKLIRERDLAVAITTNANFLQLSILSIIIDGPLEQTKNPHRILNGNRLNIVSGLTVGGLALLALIEERGWHRRTPVQANLLGQTLGLEAPEEKRLPSTLWTYLNSPSNLDNSLTRRAKLMEYWKSSKVLPVNINRPSTAQQLAACGPRHHQRGETIRLITARITMLFDLRAMIERFNNGLVELLQALD